MIEAITALAILLVLAVIAETIIMVLKAVFPFISNIPDSRVHPELFLAVLVGIMLCFGSGVRLLALLGIEFQYPVADFILTGLLVGRGSNFVHDLIGRLNAAKEGNNPAPG